MDTCAPTGVDNHLWYLNKFLSDGYEIEAFPSLNGQTIIVFTGPLLCTRFLPYDITFKETVYIFWEVSKHLKLRERKWTGFGHKQNLTV